ncbi:MULTISPECIES: hypothetical protein [unclassified Mesorhizobium]|uniref:hypothetical protein n=1 Tax=unclassified Mesorhizobium TaxID=325217 RepID=UPI003100AAC9
MAVTPFPFLHVPGPVPAPFLFLFVKGEEDEYGILEKIIFPIGAPYASQGGWTARQLLYGS